MARVATEEYAFGNNTRAHWHQNTCRSMKREELVLASKNLFLKSENDMYDVLKFLVLIFTYGLFRTNISIIIIALSSYK